jgi:hypothetical protein
MREYNYPDPDKKILSPKDWFRFFGKKRKKLDQRENLPPEE